MEDVLTHDVAIAVADSGLPTTFVPGRNILFLTIAAALAYRRGVKRLVGGFCETDFSGYPDCRDDTVKAVQLALNLGMDERFVIDTPLMWLDKSETWALAEKFGGQALVELIIEHTHTCYHGDRTVRHDWGYGCGRCPACELRKAGYEQYRAQSTADWERADARNLMLGRNRVRKRESGDGTRLQVTEIFHSLQGEGPYAGGRPAIFIRLTDCNLRCWWCDPEWNDETDPYLSVEEIIQQARDLAQGTTTLAVITGGEPVRQPLHRLLSALHQCGFCPQIETAGTLWQDCLAEPYVDIVVSPKTPKIHPEIYNHAFAFKYVIRAGEVGEDGLPLRSTQIPGDNAVLARPRPGCPVYLSPCDEFDEEHKQANQRAVAATALKHGYRAGVQLHKVLGLP